LEKVNGKNGAKGFSKKMTEYLSRAEIYLIHHKSKNDLEIYHQISVIYEKIAGKDFLIHIALQGA
jgi:hypothetical protein